MSAAVPLAAAEIAALTDAVSEAARAAGLGGGRYVPLRVASNAVLASRDDNAVARVPLWSALAVPTRTVLANAETAASAGAPVVGPLLAEPAPLADGREATFWPLAEVPDHGAAPAEMGQTARRLHAVGADLESHWSPCTEGRRKYLAEALGAGVRSGALSAADAEKLRRLAAASAAAEEAAWDACRHVVAHNDMWPPNFVRSRGRLLLCDLDHLGRGPAEYDLACMHVSLVRAHGADAWREFLHAYGDAGTAAVDTAALEAFIRRRENSATAWAAWIVAGYPASHPDQPALRQEVRRRLRSVLDEDPDIRWSDIDVHGARRHDDGSRIPRQATAPHASPPRHP